MAATVDVEAVVPCRADRARTRLVAVLGAADGQMPTITVGPGRHRWPAKHVRVRVSTQREAGRTSVADLGWAPTGRLRRLFPVLDAEVAVTAIDDTSCLLTVAGVYRPPYGGLGRLADRAVLHRIAASTAKDFAGRLATALAQDTTRITEQREALP